MNSGDYAHDAGLPGPDDVSRLDASADNVKPARSLRTQRSLQDIQDIIDKLAAVTQQLRRPVRCVTESVALAPEAPQQEEAVGRAERGGAEQRERTDIAGDVRLALQVDTAG
jgi:hypothetical protein